MHNISGEDNQGRLMWSQNLERPLQGVQLRSEAKVLFFVGCVASFFPAAYGAPQSFTRLLETAGVDYALLSGEEWCCGYPLLINGMGDQAKELIEHNIVRAKEMGAVQVVTTCPSCFHTWRYIYEEVIGEKMGLEVLHSTQFIEGLIKEGKLELKELPLKVTYHDPCDLGRKSGLYAPPRAILEKIPSLSLVEMAENRANARCCGGGGNLETYDPVLTHEISQHRLSQALDAGAELIVTACPQCQRTLVAAARRRGTRVKVLDVSELVSKATRKGERDKGRKD
jgi:Fe-S oxidoreductase